MGKCICHPEVETSFYCMKHNKYLCEECLKCQDPNIYCKFRSSCPVWFMEKRQKFLDEETAERRDLPVHRVEFQPAGKMIKLRPGETLLEAARKADIHLNASCNGKGSCGKCKLVLVSGEVDSPPTPLLSNREKEKNYILACQSRPKDDDVVVRIPDEALERKLKVAGAGRKATEMLSGLVKDIDPVLKEISLKLPPPSLDDSVSDLDRLNRELKKHGCDIAHLNVGLKVIRQLSEVIRKDHWKVTAGIVQRRCSNEILEVRPGNGSGSLGLAIDLGTTSIVVYLVEMAKGDILAATSGHNRQAACGDDVINRMICAEKDGVRKLSRMALATINNLISEALDSAGAKADTVKNVVISGNTTMAHLLLQIDPSYIRREPYVPTVSEFPILKAGEIGLKTNPIAAVFVMPSPASYVGGDIVSGLLFTGFYKEEPLTLFVDVGTNGEIVLGNREWLMAAACSAGPAFEGGGVRWGMRAEEGAIEKVVIDQKSLEPEICTVGGLPPRGICGSGMIDLISELLDSGVIDRSGRFQRDLENQRIIRIDNEPAYVLVFANETPMEEDIIFSESDLKNLIYSKGAVYAGFSTLLNETGLLLSDLERIIITGGFGQYLNIEKAIRIGLLPDLDRNIFKYMGNSSIAGAYMALLSGIHRKRALEICNRMTYIDFSSNTRYMDEFTSALFLPHTNLENFPSVTAGKG